MNVWETLGHCCIGFCPRHSASVDQAVQDDALNFTRFAETLFRGVPEAILSTKMHREDQNRQEVRHRNGKGI